MLQVSRLQREAMSSQHAAHFRQRALAHLVQQHPGWCAGREADALQRHVQAAVSFAARKDVHGEANILRLLDAALMPGFAAAAQGAGFPHYRLTQPGFDETTRVRNFIAALADPQGPQLISLDTDLSRAAR